MCAPWAVNSSRQMYALIQIRAPAPASAARPSPRLMGGAWASDVPAGTLICAMITYNSMARGRTAK